MYLKIVVTGALIGWAVALSGCELLKDLPVKNKTSSEANTNSSTSSISAASSVATVSSVASSISSIGSLVMYFSFNGNASNAAGSSYNGSMVGSPALTNDRFGNSGKAYYFNGSNDGISIPGTESMNLQSGFTLSVWVRFTDNTKQRNIIAKHQPGYGNGFFLGQGYQLDNGRLTSFVDSDTRLVSVSNYNDNAWHFLASTYDGLNHKLYVDGVLIDSQTKAYTSVNSEPFRIGFGGTDYYFKGIIDDVRIYNYAVSPQVLQNLFQETKDYSTNLIMYYPFNGNVNNAAGANYNGSMTGTLTVTNDRFGSVNSAYWFNGTNTGVSIPGSESLNLQSGFTLSVWVRFTDNTKQRNIITKHQPGYGNGFFLGQGYQLDNGRLTSFVDSDTRLVSVSNYNDNAWHFLASTYDGLNHKLYIDGALIDSQIKAYTSVNSEPYRIGFGGSDFYFMGIIDDVRVYNCVIDVYKVSNLFNSSGY